jgi:hypothetical protein
MVYHCVSVLYNILSVKLLLVILLFPCVVNAQHKSDTLHIGNEKFILLSVSDDGIPLYINNDLLKRETLHTGRVLYKSANDTIGPVLRLVSDTAHDHWNGVSAMWAYEVVTIESSYGCDKCPPRFIHFNWLDSKKKQLTLKVWEEYK